MRSRAIVRCLLLQLMSVLESVLMHTHVVCAYFTTQVHRSCVCARMSVGDRERQCVYVRVYVCVCACVRFMSPCSCVKCCVYPGLRVIKYVLMVQSTYRMCVCVCVCVNLWVKEKCDCVHACVEKGERVSVHVCVCVCAHACVCVCACVWK